jgi:hypothetical protein
MAPPKRDTEAVLVRLHRKTLNALDEFSKDDPENPSRQELIRRIIVEWFNQKGMDVRE